MSDADLSPGERLRRKLAASREAKFADFDREFIAFASRANSIAMSDFSANALGEGSLEVFCRELYEEFRASGDSDLDSWLRRQLPKRFLCVDEAPQWIEEEPAWAFFEGRPMVFISQKTLPANTVTESALGMDQTLYWFGVRIPEQDGFRLHYETVTQFNALA